ncbi:hypothetical protein JVX98_12800 [Ensifer sp. PDNC004]|uniref:hypothetical protein n=1 Tax=Ensifer sp. PDNC004 TaxID=2811423 RepID=UPI001963B467|nr:hypothetical protein [Ensifer sp. PDNC004]QRY69104.1 hypothetical protein JVX98_12800 [Ensifer sp. PDNC004]
MIHASLIKAAVSASGAMAEINAAAEYLAEAMKRIHGGSWRIQVDHDDALVVICRRSERGRAAPRPEIA